MRQVSNNIQTVKFYNLEYTEFLKQMKKAKKLDDAFIYCDPPYLPDDALVNQKQELYTSNTFDHKLFFNLLIELKEKLNIMISMADSKIADTIYYNLSFEKIDMGKIIRTINPKKLFSSKEVAFINYYLNEIEKDN